MKVLQRSNRPGEFTIPLGAARFKDLSRVGGKAVHLGEMLAAGLPVPPGFVITTEACNRFLQSDPGMLDWLRNLETCDPKDSEVLRAAVEETMRRLNTMPIPDEIARAIAVAMASDSTAAWAVRSSATAEDSPEASFAGQHDSFLNVRGAEAVAAAVKRCWLSLFSERAISYRLQKHIATGRTQMAVVVQHLIDADAAGVMFTADPAGDSDGIFIEAAFGLAEAVVQGKVTPDRLKVSRSRRRTVRRDTAVKRMQVVVDENGVREDSLRLEKGSIPALNDQMAGALAELGLKAELLFGAPQDIEWAQRDGKLFLLQSRPITGKASARTWEDRQIWTNWNTGEIAPDVMAPITWCLMQSLLEGTACRSLFRLLGVDARRAPLLGLVAGRVYFNTNVVMAGLKPFSFLLAGATDLFHAVGGAPAEVYGRARAIPAEDLPDLGFRWPKYMLSWPRVLFDLLTHLPGHGESWAARFKIRTDELVQRNVQAMPTPELVRLCAEIIREPFKDVDLLYLAAPAAALPVLQKACRDWLGEPEPAFIYRLFSALGGMPTAEAGLALWRLAILAHADADTGAAVGSEDEWPEVFARLQKTEHGRTFLSAWDAFMLEHGHHCRGELELFNARWSETPDYILGLVRGYFHSMGRSDPLENRRRLASERERLTEECRGRLKNPIKRWIFSWSLHRAQKLAVFREQLKNQGVRQLAFARRALLTLGRRLYNQGILPRSDDIFFLDISELEPVSTGDASFDWQERVDTRRREYERNLKFSPPPLVVGRFDPNAMAETMANAEAKILKGVPVSPGIVNGIARVILRADSRQCVLPDEILVAPFTDPAWSPYFLVAAGLVIEQGGILSHGSIVAREYGLPAVTNVDAATRVIHTGDLVQVNGNCGQVTILARGPDHRPESTRPLESLER